MKPLPPCVGLCTGHARTLRGSCGPRTAADREILAFCQNHLAPREFQTGKFSPIAQGSRRKENMRGRKHFSAFCGLFRRRTLPDLREFCPDNLAHSLWLRGGSKKERFFASEILLESGSILKKRDFRRSASTSPPQQKDFPRRILISPPKTDILSVRKNITRRQSCSFVI